MTNGYFYSEGGILKHSGKKGSKWGYNNGVRNGKRTAVNINDKVFGRLSDRALGRRGLDWQPRYAGTPGSANFNATVRPTKEYYLGKYERQIGPQETPEFPKFRDSIRDTISEWKSDMKDAYSPGYKKITGVIKKSGVYGLGEDLKSGAKEFVREYKERRKRRKNASYYKPAKRGKKAYYNAQLPSVRPQKIS